MGKLWKNYTISLSSCLDILLIPFILGMFAFLNYLNNFKAFIGCFKTGNVEFFTWKTKLSALDIYWHHYKGL